MRTRTVIAIFIAFVLTLGITAMWSASTIEREGDTDANALEDSGNLAGNVDDEGNVKERKKGGNKIVRAFAAPFKAFGRLFSNKDERRPQRMTEKDAEKFESAGVARIEDSRTPQTEKLSPTASAKEHLAVGRSLLLSGRFNEAIMELSIATSIDPKLSEAHNLLGVAYDRKGLTDRAKDSYERAVKVEPEDAQTLNNLGFSLYQNGNYRAAVDKLKRAAKLAPTDERILNNLSLALCRLGKFQEAFRHFARAAGPVMGNLNTGRMLERFGRDDEAIRYYEDARRLDPSSTLTLRRLTDLYKRTGNLEQSQAAANALANISLASAATGK